MAKTDAEWADIRGEFRQDGPINFANMALASNPRRVRESIAGHGRRLDKEPWIYLKQSLHQEEERVCNAVSSYFSIPASHIALTTGTTLGLALMYGGLRIRPDQEILTTAHEFSRALEIMEWRQRRDGTRHRRLMLMPDPHQVTTDSVISMLKRELRPETKVLALTWVYSNTGVKMPLPAIAHWLRTEVNVTRQTDDKVLLCVDGVHGFGAEGTSFPDLGCDFMVSGCHKWVFGPRGTGIWCGTPEAWDQCDQLVPTSSNRERLGLKFSPGGVQAYEHVWALEEAFTFLTEIGPQEIAARVHTQATRIKQALVDLKGKIRLITPMQPEYSAGIICLDVAGFTAGQAVEALFKQGIVATTSSSDGGRPWASHLRLSVSPFVTDDEIDKCVRTIASL